jgi:hypothetical protein
LARVWRRRAAPRLEGSMVGTGSGEETILPGDGGAAGRLGGSTGCEPVAVPSAETRVPRSTARTGCARCGPSGSGPASAGGVAATGGEVGPRNLDPHHQQCLSMPRDGIRQTRHHDGGDCHRMSRAMGPRIAPNTNQTTVERSRWLANRDAASPNPMVQPRASTMGSIWILRPPRDGARRRVPAYPRAGGSGP